ncbi:hypothetical protein JI739_18685 [Ramlibacter sp. AW1]|uniref:Uncharacterized protein n=1 Tax=Ramlibacter aurantiacus TaxID=2801330 RepID=A0A936ZK55_9BURK|nr:hypothetical protein [Ramlibacter aurantiacus]MBL0422382.1 hypothetical protein [Ramlibacter aurantiacus]
MTEKTASDLRILKIATCPSLSGRTAITYHVGCSDASDVRVRIWKTSGKGVYSKEWVSTTDIKKLLGKHEAIPGPLLLPLFKVGKSVNSAGFLLAVLKAEGLVSASPDQAHCYLRAPDKIFMEQVAALIASGVNLNPDVSKPSIRANQKKVGGVVGVPPWETEPHGDQVE